jgi:hypothetical protein
MYQPPPLRGRSVFDGKKVLLIDPHQRARDVRASVLRSRGIEIDATDSLQAARSLWRPKLYDLIMLDARGYIPGESLDFYLEVKHANPRMRVVFLVGPPTSDLSIADLADRGDGSRKGISTMGGDGEALRHRGLKSFLAERSTACQGAAFRLASRP